MTAFAPADWLALFQAAPSMPAADTEPFGSQLEDYRLLLDRWQQALEAGAAEPARVALAALARHIDRQRPRQLRRVCSPGPWFEPLVELPVPAVAAPALPALPLPGWLAAGAGFWLALVSYRQKLDAFCLPYQGLGTRTLTRLEQARPATAITSAAGLFAHWQLCQDQVESEIVRAPSWVASSAGVAAAAAALRVAHRQCLEAALGVQLDGAGQRALSEELAAIRRQLRKLTQGA
ncbi:hypothetical protein PG2T_01830 [Immundisolibacter cernigliae]|uniref:Poly(3-hydroxyalkanoate) polymerase subunit PhaE n=2 Tax=Immundisolibacter cernigliae TaxID=1810504 RepID=A0A1B1YQJ9_9GAMM|nr:hypothetical protein PG2T_01830 [Immundisolibacter cernigliae]